MSGHSKWSTIKHGKAVTDARRGQLFTKLTKEIIVAARDGSDVESNFRLRMAVQKAKDGNMPSSTIDRAIKKGSGDGSEQDRVEEVLYEGYGPGGTAILLHVLTDNRNRAVSTVRSAFTKSGGNMSEAGAVSWQFEQKGVLVADVDASEADEMALLAIDAGADDFDTVDSTIQVYCAPDRLEALRQALSGTGASIRSSELAMAPTNTIVLDESTAIQTLRLLDLLEDLEDVQKVYSNADFPDVALERYRAQGPSD